MSTCNNMSHLNVNFLIKNVFPLTSLKKYKNFKESQIIFYL